MRVISTKNEKEMGQHAAAMIIEKIHSKPSARLGLATGGTPIGTYQQMIRDYWEGNTSYQDVVTFNLDEYIGLSVAHPNSFRHFMEDQLFQHLDFSSNNTHLPNGAAKSMDEECQRYETLITCGGGIDLQLLGIGENGHIGFNEPSTSFASKTHTVQLTESTRKANSRFFKSLEEVPKKAITMGIQSILRGKEILILASGLAKSKAVARFIHGEVNQQFPASALKGHENVTLIADEQALSLTDLSGKGASFFPMRAPVKEKANHP